jgi:hypothetical protein
MLSMTSWLYRTVKYIHGGGSNAVSAVDARQVEKVKLNVASQKVVKFKIKLMSRWCALLLRYIESWE